MTTDAELLTLICKLFASFPNTNVNEQTVTVYLEILADIPVAELRTAINQCLAECKFLPTIAELREKHRQITGALAQQTAAEAWTLVLKAIRREGSWHKPEFNNPITEKTVDAMGWRELCLSEAPPGVDRAQFERIYNSFLDRQAQMAKLLPGAQELLESSAANGVVKRLAESMRLADGIDSQPNMEAEHGD